MAQPISSRKFRPRQPAWRSCAQDWSKLQKNMLKRCWPRTSAAMNCTIVACWKSIAVGLGGATRFLRLFVDKRQNAGSHSRHQNLLLLAPDPRQHRNRNGSRASSRQFPKGCGRDSGPGETNKVLRIAKTAHQ